VGIIFQAISTKR